MRSMNKTPGFSSLLSQLPYLSLPFLQALDELQRNCLNIPDLRYVRMPTAYAVESAG